MPRLLAIAVPSVAILFAAHAARADKSGFSRSHRMSAATDGPAEMVATRALKARERPKKGAPAVFRIDGDEVVRVIATRRSWARVQNHAGKRGWVRASALEELLVLDAPGSPAAPSAEAAVIDSDADLEAEIGDASDDGPAPSRDRLAASGVTAELRGALGLSSYGRDFRSDGGGPLGGYTLSVSSVVADVGGEISMRKGALVALVSGRYAGAVAAPGVRYQGVDGMSGANRLVTHEIDTRVEVGALVGERSPLRITAGAGYRVGYFVVDEIQDNPGLLARERLTGPTAGVALATAFGAKAIVSLRFDVLLPAELRQTANLEDGTDSEVSGYGGGAGVRYQLSGDLAVSADYRGESTSYTFTGQSRRQFDVTEAERTDTVHALTVGAARSF